jgi:pilus assembly protein Flp/PilA
MKAPRTLARFIRLENGATAIEYAFIASLISVVIYTAAVLIGGDLATIFSSVGSQL